MRITDKIFGWLLLLSSLLHGWGSWMHYHAQPEMLLWAEGAGLAGMLVAALNLMRANRPQDRTLAWAGWHWPWTLAGWWAACWISARRFI